MPRCLRVLDAEPRDYGRLLVTLGVAPLPGGVVRLGRGTFVFESQTEDWHARPWFAESRSSSRRVGEWPPSRWWRWCR